MARLFGLLLLFPFAKVKHRCPFSWPSAGTRRQCACRCGDLESSCLAWQVANYPLVPDEPPPDELWTFPQVAWFLNVAGIFCGFGTCFFFGCFTTMVKDRVFALTIEPKKLAGIRLTP